MFARRALPAPDALWAAYADDLALTLRHVMACLARVQTVLRLLRLATALALSAPKTVMAPLFGWESEDAVRAEVSRVAPSFSELQIAGHARYLGVLLGPTARPVFWRAAAAKFWSRLCD